MTATLYVVPGSHPCATVMRALEMKGVPYKTVDWVPGFHKLPQRLRFGAPTVPGIKYDNGHKVVGSRAILRDLEARIPDPPLYDGRQAVADAEAWGDEVLQPLVRRILWHALGNDTSAQRSFLEGARLRPPSPTPVVRASGAPLAWFLKKANGATPETLDDDLAALPVALDKIDGWIEDGTLGGEQLNAADLQIAASVRLASTLDDLKPVIDPRPAGRLARNCFEHYPGRVPAGALSGVPGA
jgi:glutathione S-transferase